MFSMADYLQSFSENIYCYITKQNKAQKCALINIHGNHLAIHGECSFPTNISVWMNHMKTRPSAISQNGTILNIISAEDKKEQNKSVSEITDSVQDAIHNIVQASQQWQLSIKSMKLSCNRCCIYLDRNITYQRTIRAVLLETKYGYFHQDKMVTRVLCDKKYNVIDLDLNELRMHFLKIVTEKFLIFLGHQVCDAEEITDLQLLVTNKSNLTVPNNIQKIVCGVVTHTKDKKKTNINAYDFLSKRTSDMKLMAQHRYGFRVGYDSHLDEQISQLGHAAAIFELMQVKPNRNLYVNLENFTMSSSKGAAFVMYNCARLATIIKMFQDKVTTGYYPPLPSLETVDFSLLDQDEEWELMYCYILNYPRIVRKCTENILSGIVNPHYLCSFLSSMVSSFSAYYKRTKILTDSRKHLMAVMHSRLYLLLALQRVMHNALNILCIKPISRM